MTAARACLLLALLPWALALLPWAPPLGVARAEEPAGPPAPTAPPGSQGSAGGSEAAEGAPQEEAPLGERIDAAIARGVAHLVETQNADGSWGTPARTLFLDIYAPVPGALRAFQVASSALALSALIEVGGDAEDVAQARERAAAWLVAHHDVRRATADTIYNVWAHAYALEAFARLLEREKDEEARARIREAADRAVDLLARYEFVDGGWGYYDFQVRARRPGPGATSFTTATVLVALRRVAAQGVEVPEPLVRRALRLVRSCRFPSGSFAYSFRHRLYPQGGINKIKGSLARTPACLEALAGWEEAVPLRDLRKAFEDLEKEGHFLRIARKYPIPHETWYQNSGYFCFYGYWYASLLMHRLPLAEREREARRIAGHVLPLQEKDGSWWDYQLYRYHKPYGTGYVLMTLGRARAALGP